MKNTAFPKKMLLILLLPMGMLLTFFASKNPLIIEKYYSSGLYRLFSQSFSFATGLLPFSLGEILFIVLILYVLSWLTRKIISIVKYPNELKKNLLKAVQDIAIFCSVLYFIFVIMWGLNYHRLPFATITDLSTQKSSVIELSDLCESLVIKANGIRENISENSDGVMEISMGKKDLYRRTNKGYEKLSEIYPQFKGSYGVPKRVFLSKVMSYMGISGIFSPFTYEANINDNIPDSLIPVTVCHEVAHQYGFSREDEANFIAYMTCMVHPDIDFQYSGTLLALIYTMNELYDYDYEKYLEVSDKYSEGLKRDLIAIDRYWQRYEGTVSKASSKLNDTYLKANSQGDGVASYGRMVDLLLAYHKKHSKIK